jgi:hypothetical protein
LTPLATRPDLVAAAVRELELDAGTDLVVRETATPTPTKVLLPATPLLYGMLDRLPPRIAVACITFPDSPAALRKRVVDPAVTGEFIGRLCDRCGHELLELDPLAAMHAFTHAYEHDRPSPMATIAERRRLAWAAFERFEASGKVDFTERSGALLRLRWLEDLVARDLAGVAFGFGPGSAEGAAALDLATTVLRSAIGLGKAQLASALDPRDIVNVLELDEHRLVLVLMARGNLVEARAEKLRDDDPLALVRDGAPRDAIQSRCDAALRDTSLPELVRQSATVIQARLTRTASDMAVLDNFFALEKTVVEAQLR